MRAIIVYESMFGNTRTVAEAIGRGLGRSGEVTLVRSGDADQSVLEGTDLVVVGGPTHAWSMSRASTRKGVPDYAAKAGRSLTVEPGAATAPGVREWLGSLGHKAEWAAAFDTRIKGPALLTGRASKAIGRALTHHGLALTLPPESFLVDKASHLIAGEEQRAEAWGERLAVARLRKTEVAA